MNQQGQAIHSNYEPNVDNLMKYIKGAQPYQIKDNKLE